MAASTLGTWDDAVTGARKGKAGGGPATNPNDIHTKLKQQQPEFSYWKERKEVLYRDNVKASPSEPQMNYDVMKQGDNKNIKTSDFHRPNGGRVMNSVEPRANTTQGVKSFDGAKKSPIHPGAATRGRATTTQHRSHATAGPSPSRSGGASVPVFGGWKKNPAQAENYTDIFKKITQDKRNGNVFDVETTPNRSPYSPTSNTKQSKRSGCLSWLFG